MDRKLFGLAVTKSHLPGELERVSATGSFSPSKPPNASVPASQYPYIAEEALMRVQIRAQRSSQDLYTNFRTEKLQEETMKMTFALTRAIISPIQPLPSQDSFDSGIVDQDFDQLLGELQSIGQPQALNTQPLQAAIVSLRALAN